VTLRRSVTVGSSGAPDGGDACAAAVAGVVGVALGAAEAEAEMTFEE